MSDAPKLAPSEIDDLRALAGVMVPADEHFAVPGADDEAIFDDIVRSIGRDLADVRDALLELARCAEGSFAALDPAQQESIALAYLAAGGPWFEALSRVVLQCYYRDDRVLIALGLEARPPFPQGYTLESGDWSLLDAVRGRAPIWRDTP